MSTADIFDGSTSAVQAKKIVNLIVDPRHSHFFNTDCLSCHTETHFATVAGNQNPPGIDPEMQPKSNWNVGNFGWFPSGGTVAPTITMRTAAETAEVVNVVNEKLVNNWRD